MRGSEISAVGVWGVSMSMRVRHGLRARGALVSTPLFEIQALTGGPWASKNARSRSIGKFYVIARNPDDQWHRLGMGRLVLYLSDSVKNGNALSTVHNAVLPAR